MEPTPFPSSSKDRTAKQSSSLLKTMDKKTTPNSPSPSHRNLQPQPHRRMSACSSTKEVQHSPTTTFLLLQHKLSLPSPKRKLTPSSTSPISDYELTLWQFSLIPSAFRLLIPMAVFPSRNYLSLKFSVTRILLHSRSTLAKAITSTSKACQLMRISAIHSSSSRISWLRFQISNTRRESARGTHSRSL